MLGDLARDLILERFGHDVELGDRATATIRYTAIDNHDEEFIVCYRFLIEHGELECYELEFQDMPEQVRRAGEPPTTTILAGYVAWMLNEYFEDYEKYAHRDSGDYEVEVDLGHEGQQIEIVFYQDGKVNVS